MTRNRAIDILVGILTVAVVVLAILTIINFSSTLRRVQDASRTHAALCTFWDDLHQRAVGGRAFLLTHPHGILGISAATLRTSIQGQERTLKSLSGLGCVASRR